MAERNFAVRQQKKQVQAEGCGDHLRHPGLCHLSCLCASFCFSPAQTLCNLALHVCGSLPQQSRVCTHGCTQIVETLLSCSCSIGVSQSRSSVYACDLILPNQAEVSLGSGSTAQLYTSIQSPKRHSIGVSPSSVFSFVS